MLTRFQFRSRFTQAEKVAIEIASLDDPTAPMQQRALAATLRASNTDVNVSGEVDVTLQATIDGVMALEQYGLIGPGRAIQILAASGPGQMDQVALATDQISFDGKAAVKLGGIFAADALVPVYRAGDENKVEVGALHARFIASGEFE